MFRGYLTAFALFLCASAPASAADQKNWSPPNHKIYAQQLSDETMKAHPELLSVTLHGVPPGMSDAYTMFAGSYLDRIGNADDPDDIDVSKKGITIVDPRWHRTKDQAPKFVVLMPLRDRTGRMSAWSSTRSRSQLKFERRRAQILSQSARSSRRTRQAHSQLRRTVCGRALRSPARAG